MLTFSTYNVMSGGFDTYDKTLAIPNRISDLQRAIKLINASVISLVDTFRWKSYFTKDQLKELFGYEYVECIDMDDTRVDPEIGITLLSNIPILRSQTVRLHNRNALVAQLQHGERVINFATLYLDDLSEDVRLTQMKALLELGIHHENFILAGDLNSVRRSDIELARPKEEEFLRNNPQYQPLVDTVIGGMKRGEVHQLLLDNGLVDVFPQFTPSMPTQLFPGNIVGPIIQLDHSFRSPDLEIQNAQVLYGPEFDKASDHYPIRFDLV